MNRIPHRQYLTAVMAALALCSFSSVLHADDTEIFEVQANSNTASRPKVLIVFDDSGSMQTIVEGQRPPYDPDQDYDGGVDDFDRIYWSTDGEAPDADSDQWFEKSQNRCASSFAALENQGFSGTSGARRWVNSSTTQTCENVCTRTIFFGLICVEWEQVCEITEVPGRWSALSTSAHSPPHVECKADVINEDSGNGPGVADGYALENVSDAQALGAATPQESIDSGVDWGDGDDDSIPVFYSANYVDYWNDDSLEEDRTRMEIAEQVIGDLIEANTSVDFALATFNRNQNTVPPQHGGRIVHRLIEDMDAAERSSLVSLARNGLETEDFSLTPLCETMYEVYRYYKGSSVLYGNQKAAQDVPDRDTDAESNGNYISPLGDCAFIYTILMTDGQPTFDTAANNAIESLTGETCAIWGDGFGDDVKNCLPNLAGYMSSVDLDDDDTNGVQKALTYTIGFGLGEGQEDMLIETANRGGGQHFTALNADDLANAFQGALLNILTTDTSFTSPAVAVDSFTRTEVRDDVFYAMFKPGDRVDWRGNIKKFKIARVGGELTIVDKNGVPAFDEVSGEFKESASSFWSNSDGGSVESGGVGGLLANRDPATRTIYSNTGNSGALELFNDSNVVPDAFGFPDNATLWGHFGVGSQADFDNVLAWAQGFAIENGVATENPRDWIMGDVLHSRPQVINYGARGAFTEDNPDLRVVVGTNAGFVHMFGGDDGQEDWSFFPKELAGVLNNRRINNISNDNIYGVDLASVIYRVDVNRDGTIDTADGDKVWAYFGLRRGGRLLYALDISNPDSPSFLWQISPANAGFGELGQTWSRPLPTFVPGYVNGDNKPQPVVIFGAGYDTNKDASGVGTPDSMGRGIFVVDAETGALVRSITPAAASLTNVQDTRLVHSVPGEIAGLDFNVNGFADRVYFGDTGGNVWRVDIGERLPDANDSTETWFVSHFADLNDGTVANDRRFFNKPGIVLTRLQDSPVDLITIGSGDRTNPLATDVQNYFYVLRDWKTSRYRTPDPTAAECDAADPDNLPLDFRCSQPLTQGALFDITSDILNTGTEAEQTTAKAELLASSGWMLQLTGSGEKNLSDSRTSAGEVTFATFTPASLLNNNPDICEPAQGGGTLYTVNIFDGEREERACAAGTICEVPPMITPPPPEPECDGEDCPSPCEGNACDPLPIFPQNTPDGPFGEPGANPIRLFPSYWYSEDF